MPLSHYLQKSKVTVRNTKPFLRFRVTSLFFVCSERETPFLITHQPFDDSSNPRQLSPVFHSFPERGDYYRYVNPRRFTITGKLTRQVTRVVSFLLCLATIVMSGLESRLLLSLKLINT